MAFIINKQRDQSTNKRKRSAEEQSTVELHLLGKLTKKLGGVTVIILDEVSMVGPSDLTTLDACLQQVCTDPAKEISLLLVFILFLLEIFTISSCWEIFLVQRTDDSENRRGEKTCNQVGGRSYFMATSKDCGYS